MTTTAIIEATLERLKATLPELALELYPDRTESSRNAHTVDDYRLNHPVGALLLGYPGSVFAPPRPLGLVAQRRTLRLDAILVVRRIWGEHGAVELLERLRRALVGWMPPHGGKLYAESERFLAEKAGVWWYGAVYAVDLLTTEDLEAVTEPRLAQVTITDDYPTVHTITRDDTGAVITEYQD